MDGISILRAKHRSTWSDQEGSNKVFKTFRRPDGTARPDNSERSFGATSQHENNVLNFYPAPPGGISELRQRQIISRGSNAEAHSNVLSSPPISNDMRKLIIGVSVALIFISVYGLLKAASDAKQIKSTFPTAVAASPTPTPDKLLASAAPTPDPTPQSTPGPLPASTVNLEPLKMRVVEHQPDQFRQGALSEEELSAIKKAIETIPWSRNSNPEAAAKEDYAAIVKECEKSGVHGLLTDLITEAVSNDYQPNNEAANGAYSLALNADFESNERDGSSNAESTADVSTDKGASVDSGSTPTKSQPEVPKNTTSQPPAPSPTPAVAVPSKIVHVKHRPTVKHKIVDAKTRLLELWHQSLAH
jgi:hypothetical protein